MHDDVDDMDLLRRFAREREEEAFAELVRRHLNLVHSAALRQVRSPQLAEEVAQSVFTDLARDATRLKPGTILAAWLYEVARRTAIDVVRREMRRQLREQVAVEMNAMNSTSSDWAQVEPLLDDAMAALDDTDRTAVLLRFFENKSLREVGAVLGTSDDTAQKRVSRAVERLRDFFAQRGVTVGTSGLVVVISTNAVQASPVGLAAVISTASVLTGATLATTATVTTTKAIAMTSLQKTLVVTVLAASVGTGIYEAHQAIELRAQVHALQQQQVPLREQIQAMQRQRDQSASQFSAAQREIEQLKRDAADIYRLRGEIGVLRRQITDGSSGKPQLRQATLSTALEYYKRAQKHESEHDYEAEFEDLNKAIELDPNLAEAYAERAALYAQKLPKSRGGYAKAIDDYTRYLELKPKDASFRHNRALYFADLGQFDNAIADYTLVIEGDMDFSKLGDGKDKLVALDLFSRARIYHYQKRDYFKAIADYTAALKLDPQREGAHKYRGLAYESLGETEKSQQDFAIEPKNK